MGGLAFDIPFFAVFGFTLRQNDVSDKFGILFYYYFYLFFLGGGGKLFFMGRNICQGKSPATPLLQVETEMHIQVCRQVPRKECKEQDRYRLIMILYIKDMGSRKKSSFF